MKICFKILTFWRWMRSNPSLITTLLTAQIPPPFILFHYGTPPPPSPTLSQSTRCRTCPSLAYHHLIKLIEVTRVHLFDVLTQYNAVFPDSHLDDRSEPLKRGVYYSWITLKVVVSACNPWPLFVYLGCIETV